MLEEQLAIFLYICVTGLTVHHVSEHFQHSSSIISWYFYVQSILRSSHLTDYLVDTSEKWWIFFSSLPFYMTYVQFPSGNNIPAKIQWNSKFFLYFRDTIRAINGSHISIPITPPALFHPLYHNCKGFLSQNTLFTYDFNLNFMYMLIGWEGSASASDVCVYGNVIGMDLPIPAGKYLLADAGFPQEPGLLVPYCSV